MGNMFIEDLLGNGIGVFIGLTVILFGGAAFMTGQALAGTWRPAWHLLPYGLLLAAANRFFSWSLFGGALTSISGFLIDAAILVALGALAYRLTKAYRMVSQYPWLYERHGLFSWRDRAGEGAPT